MLDEHTGVIYGAPTAVTPSTEYTVTATNSIGFTQATLVITTVSVPFDFDGDGKADILFQNSSTKKVAIWLMNGLTQKEAQVITPDTDLTDWKVPQRWQIY